MYIDRFNKTLIIRFIYNLGFKGESRYFNMFWWKNDWNEPKVLFPLWSCNMAATGATQSTNLITTFTKTAFLPPTGCWCHCRCVTTSPVQRQTFFFKDEFVCLTRNGAILFFSEFCRPFFCTNTMTTDKHLIQPHSKIYWTILFTVWGWFIVQNRVAK